jgi:hypothetical protein
VRPVRRAVRRRVGGAPPESAGLGHVDLVAQGLAIVALLAWTGAIGAAGGALMRRRDVQ